MDTRCTIPCGRLITKYGKPETSDFSPEDFRPFKAWKSRAIIADLSDDGKKVVCINFHFTDKEGKDALEAKYGRFDKAIKKVLQPNQDIFDEVAAEKMKAKKK